MVCAHTQAFVAEGPPGASVCAVMGAIAEHAEISNLHVRQNNIRAIHLYRRLVMRGTRTLHCANLTNPEGQTGSSDFNCPPVNSAPAVS